MQPNFSEVSVLTILISTLLLFLVGTVFIYFFFRHQKKRREHQIELLELKETFNNTLLQSKLEIQEHTLDHISKELHANFSHLLSLININLSLIIPEVTDKIKESMYETKLLAKELMGELKALSVGLNTDKIMQIGFPAALESELNRLEKSKKYATTLVKKGEEQRIKPEYGIILFRLCQEILNNIINHAKATSIHVLLDYSGNLLILEITDNGIGFDPSATINKLAENRSTGLMNMKQRAKLIEGTFSVKSKPGMGTSCIVTLPTWG